MSDTLVIAISQSGTTTDTNRTVDVARSRGAAVIGIVNRRNSDLTERSRRRALHVRRPRRRDERRVDEGVLRTGRGRLPAALARSPTWSARPTGEAPIRPAARPARPSRRDATGDRADAATIAEAAQRLAPARRYWAVVGNGLNRVAAEEVRIKLSELCYKSIACDATEDKKHIDLSSEPLILVCAAGLSGSNADDVAKEVAIYRAHKAAPIVIASDGDERFNAAPAVISVPDGASVAGVRAVGHGRPPLRVRGGAGHRRAGSPAA